MIRAQVDAAWRRRQGIVCKSLHQIESEKNDSTSKDMILRRQFLQRYHAYQRAMGHEWVNRMHFQPFSWLSS